MYEDKQVPDSDVESLMNHQSFSPSVQSEENTEVSSEEKPVQTDQPLLEEPIVEAPPISNDVKLETHAEGEDGWQPVQRPRSAGLFGKRPRQRRQHGSKIFNNQKKDFVVEVDHARLKNNHQSGKYYVVKKRAMSPGGFAEYYVAKNPSSGPKLGRKAVKTVAYRVKSVSSSTTDVALEGSKNEDKTSHSSSDQAPVYLPKEVVAVAKRSSIVSLGKSPSYKEVAVAPPGTISMLQVRLHENDVHQDKELEGQHIDVKEESGSVVLNAEIDKEENDNLFRGSTIKDENEASDTEVAIHSDDAKNDENLVVVPENIAAVESGCNELSQIDEQGNHVDVPNYAHSLETGTCTEDSLESTGPNDDSESAFQEIEGLQVKPSIIGPNDAREISSKKLSASAAPYNPSVVAPRVAPLPMNIPPLSGPGAVPPNGPWPMNIGLHPGHAAILPSPVGSPHHPYPSPPQTPNMIHSLPFIYPPYTQAQSMPPSNFQVPSNPFHPGQFAWQCNMRANTPEYIPVTIWPGCHPIEFPSPTLVEPIAKPILETKEQSVISDDQNLAPILPVDLDGEKDINFPASEALENLNDIDVAQSGDGDEISSSNIHVVPSTVNLLNSSSNGPNEEAHRCNDYHVQGQQQKDDNEKTFNILVRGRRNRKQMLRMPLSMLKRPYSSQSFKVVYSRVVRETEAPRSTGFDSREPSTVDAT